MNVGLDEYRYFCKADLILCICFLTFLQGHFPPVNTQPPPVKFTPSNPPMLKNLEQYQQPPTLASQLYPVCYSTYIITSPNKFNHHSDLPYLT